MGLFEKLKSKAKETVKEAMNQTDNGTIGEIINETDVKTYNREFKVVGVTFTNDDNTPRQEILKAIKEQRKPFDKRLDVLLQEYSFEGSPAIYVKVNDQIIGNIGHDDVQFFFKNQDRMLGVKNLYVGGDDGLYYARVKVVLKTKNQ